MCTLSRVHFSDNYRFILDGVPQEFYASTERQAWYFLFEMTKGELPDVFIKIEEDGVKDLLEEGGSL